MSDKGCEHSVGCDMAEQSEGDYLREDMFPTTFCWQCYVVPNPNGEGFILTPWAKEILTMVHEAFKSGKYIYISIYY